MIAKDPTLEDFDQTQKEIQDINNQLNNLAVKVSDKFGMYYGSFISKAQLDTGKASILLKNKQLELYPKSL